MPRNRNSIYLNFDVPEEELRHLANTLSRQTGLTAEEAYDRIVFVLSREANSLNGRGNSEDIENTNIDNYYHFVREENTIEMSKKKWTKKQISELLENNDIMVERSIIQLWKKQTAEERATESTIEFNGVGFNGVDALFLTSLANHINNSNYQEGDRLTAKQRAAARIALKKYVGQLTKIANKEI